MNKLPVLVLAMLSALFLFAGCTRSSDEQSVTPVPSGARYSLQDVALHGSRDDCYMAISGRVYDVSAYIRQHPGGETILQGCGQDATSMFVSRPGSGTPHPDRVQSTLERYSIGDLAE